MRFIGRTDRGQVRGSNQDAWGCDSELGVVVLADGMGGLTGGEVASSAAVESILQHLTGVARIDAESVRGAIAAANSRVFELSREIADGDMGTTVVVWAHRAPNHYVLGHVGDSRAFRLSGAGLEPLTRDHSVVQALVDDGALSEEEAHLAPERNLITRAVGLEADVRPEVVELKLEAGDAFLLCSDGLTDLIRREELAEICESRQQSIRELPDRLVDAANAAGGFDNITVVLVYNCAS